MLTISSVHESGGGATHYYAQDNYYTQDQCVEHSEWFGQGAEALDLAGAIDPEQFAALLRGEVDGHQLGRVTPEGVQHRPGWDLTFSAPKSVSILSEVYGIEAVRAAHNQAVRDALAHVEKQYVETRLTAGGHTMRQRTGNAVFATFTHDVSRELDPQLHTHAVLINATQTPNGWRSIANEKLMDRNAILEGGMAYRSSLARYLTDQGFTLKQHQDPSLWEIEGIPDSLMGEFSRRANQINEYFENRGLPYDSAYAKQVALLTRQKKQAVPRDELAALWRDRAEGHDLAIDLAHARSLQGPSAAGAETAADPKAARPAVKRAVTHLLEKDMSFTELDLQTTALHFDLGKVRHKDVQAECERLKASGHLVEGRESPDAKHTLWTTPGAKQAENRLITNLSQGQGRQAPLAAGRKIQRFLDKSGLNDQQASAVLSAVSSRDRFFAIQGDPGVGKTTTLRVYKDLVEKQGYQVKAFAPSYQAVNELGDSLQVPGMTVDRFLVDPRAQRQAPGTRQVWLIDETSMLDTQKLNQVMEQAERQDARVLFVGDHQQLESVGAGRGFRQLQEAGIEKATIDQRMRQKNEGLRAVVDRVMAKDYGTALDELSAIGGVQQQSLADSRHESLERLAEDYLSRSPEQQRNTLMVAPTNEQRDTINRYVREGLREQGQIKDKEFSLPVFQDQQLSEQEKQLASTYQRGQYVRFNQDYREKGVSIQRHTYYQVVGHNPDTNTVALRSTHDRQTVCVDPARVGGGRGGAIQVFKRDELAVSPGDRVRWLDNKNKHGLTRNTELSVIRATDNWVRLEDQKGTRYSMSLDDLKNRHFEHDYARTAYGVQGKTNRDVLAVMDSRRQNTVNQRSFMVSATRASHNLTVYTDSTDKLKKALSERSGDNTEALKRPEFDRTKQRNQNQHPEQPSRVRRGILPPLV